MSYWDDLKILYNQIRRRAPDLSDLTGDDPRLFPFWDDSKKGYDAGYAPEHYDFVLSGIKILYVVSGRGSALKNPVDGPDVLDPEDDHARMQYGIKLAKKIRALTGTWVPIYYNGRQQHIDDLRTALDRGGIFDYPKALFLICPTHCQRTIEQAQEFKKFITIYPEDTTVGVISTAFHLPRIARTMGKDIEQNLVLFGIDRERERPGVAQDIVCEVDAMKNYSERTPPQISRLQLSNTFLNVTDILFEQSMRLQKKEALLFQFTRPTVLPESARDLCLYPKRYHW